MQKITAIDIQRYLTYLRTEYRSTRGKPLATKTVCHLYATLGLIFSYVKRQEVISKNPMQQVEAPRKEKPEAPTNLLMRWTMKKPQDFSGFSRRYRLIFTVC